MMVEPNVAVNDKVFAVQRQNALCLHARVGVVISPSERPIHPSDTFVKHHNVGRLHCQTQKFGVFGVWSLSSDNMRSIRTDR